MPPITPQGSRAGLITAVVIFAILFVTSTIFAFIFSAKATRAEEDYTTFRKRYNGIVAEAALNSPEVDTLKNLRSAEGGNYTQNSTVLDVALGESNKLAKVAGGGATATAAATGGKAALDAAKAKLAGAAKDVTLGTDLVGSVNTLTDAVVAREGQIAQLNAQLEAANTAVTAAKEEQSKLVAAQEAAISEARAQADAANTGAQTYRGEKDQLIATTEQERDAERKKAAADAETLRTQIAEKDGLIKKLTKDIDSFRQKIASLRGNVSNAVVQQADGIILRLPGQNTAYIDLGQGDQIAPGLTFEVYDKNRGVPAPPAEAMDLPRGKASLEVLRVGSTSSECRITRLEPGEQLTEGDLIANLVYDRNTKFNFYVFGDFDLDHNGLATPNDQEVIKQLITQWGGKVVNSVNVTTDFVVVGVPPELPAFTADELNDPINKKKLDDATAAVDAFNKIVEQAGELNIPVLNQNRFLYYVGYYDQAKR